MRPTIGTELIALAEQVRRLTPSWQHPDLFHEAKSEVVGALRRLAQVSNGHAVDPVPPPAPPAPPMRIVTERVRVVVLRPHLAHPGRRHCYPRPPMLPAEVQPTLSM